MIIHKRRAYSHNDISTNNILPPPISIEQMQRVISRFSVLSLRATLFADFSRRHAPITG